MEMALVASHHRISELCSLMHQMTNMGLSCTLVVCFQYGSFYIFSQELWPRLGCLLYVLSLFLRRGWGKRVSLHFASDCFCSSSAQSPISCAMFATERLFIPLYIFICEMGIIIILIFKVVLRHISRHIHHTMLKVYKVISLSRF